MSRKSRQTKSIVITVAQQRLLIALCDAAQMGYNATEAVQRAQERNHDVGPVADGSEEQEAIWTEIHKLFDTIRLA